MNALFGVVLLILLPVISTAAADEAHVVGAGSQSCGSWLNERESMRRTKSPSPKLWGQSQWVLGFVTATNVALFPDENLTEGTNGTDMMAWLDSYCREHPLDKLGEAAAKLTLELTHRLIDRKNSN